MLQYLKTVHLAERAVNMATRMSTRDSFSAFADVLRDEMPFVTHGALRGGTHDGSFGRLPREYHDSAARASYLVFSYSTPIAWRVDGLWVMPSEQYSVTTSRHQGRIRAALEWLGIRTESVPRWARWDGGRS